MSAENLKKKWNKKIFISINEEFQKMKKKSVWIEMHHHESGIISSEKATHIFVNCKNK